MGNQLSGYKSPIDYNKPGTYKSLNWETGFIKIFCQDEGKKIPAIVTLKIPPGELITVGEIVSYININNGVGQFKNPTGLINGKFWTSNYEIVDVKRLDKPNEKCINCFSDWYPHFIIPGTKISKPVKHNQQETPSDACFFYPPEQIISLLSGEFKF